MSEEEKALCENCGKEIPLAEVQTCEVCDQEGLGNCCIGVDDHPCEDAEEADDED